MVPKTKSPLRRLFEHWKGFRLFRFWREDAEAQAHSENTIYTSDKRIDLFVGLITTIIGLAMLVIPLWILAFVNGLVGRLAIITAFLVIFLCFVAALTIARPFEALGATAG